MCNIAILHPNIDNTQEAKVLVNKTLLWIATLCGVAGSLYGQTTMLSSIKLINGTGSITLQAPSSGTVTFKFPSSLGTNGYYLVSDGAGGTSWATVPGAVSLDDLSDAKVGGAFFTNSIIIGHETTGTLSDAEGNVAFGSGALSAITSGDNNVAVGLNALLTVTSGSGNTSVGFDAGRTLAGGSVYNTLIGYFAKRDFTVATKTGDYNTVVGASAMEEGNGDYNVLLGYLSGYYVRSSNNIALGSEALGGGVLSGANNIAIGWRAMQSGGTGTENVAIGYNALKGASAASTTGSYNVGIGTDVGLGLTTGSQNTAVGYQSGSGLTAGSGNVLIGHQAGSSLTTESNRLYIDNSNTSSPLIYGDFSNDDVTINGSLKLTDGFTVAHDAAATVASDGTLTIDVSTTTAIQVTSNGDDVDDVITLSNGVNGAICYMFFIVPATKTDNITVGGTTYAIGTGKSVGLSFLYINGAWRLTGSVESP